MLAGVSFLRSIPQADLKAVLRLDPAIGVPFAQYHEFLLRGPSPLPVAMRELMAAYVSALNRCAFCHEEHDAVAQTFGIAAGTVEAILATPESSEIEPQWRPVFAYLHKLTTQPHRIEQADIDAITSAGFTDLAVYHIACIAGLFAFDNRLISGLGIPSHAPEKLAATAARLHAQGYASTVNYIRGEWDESKQTEEP